ncbi:hypothetical protein AB833_02615 [Chromatiales bacterium (ex Bugula neritina AB1)]|nr:hypothetical protein AB833_02615 [Chromatiales bacterium (ex Bugula neritina AB1)]
MRIAFFDDRYFEVYGAQENTLLLAELASKDPANDVTFCTTWPGRLELAAKARGINTCVIEAPPILRVFEKGAIRGGIQSTIIASVSAVQYSISLARHFDKNEYDVVFASSIRASLLLIVTRILRKQKVVLFAQNSTPFGLFAIFALPGVSVLAFISSGSGTTFPRWVEPFYRKKVRNLASGRDLDKFQFKDRRSREGAVNVVSICSITRRKGLHVLIDAVHRVSTVYKNITLTIVGGTSGVDSERYLSELKEIVKSRDVAVNFIGWTDRIVDELHKGDIFALTSENEGLPGVIIEAMATGLPVVTTDAGGCSDAVVEGVSGYVVPVGSSQQVCEAIIKLMDSTQRHAFGVEARNIAMSEYSIEAFEARYNLIFKEIKNS